MLRKISSLLLLLTGFSGLSQIPMQNWRVHFSVNNAVGIANDATSVYMAASNGIVQYHTDDQSIEMITLANGLSDMGISCIDGNGSTVLVGYSNGNIDLLRGNTVTNVPWVKLADLSGNKSIHSANFEGNIVYISSGIGLIVFDLSKNEVKDTYYPYANPVIFASCIHNDTLFCATENGIYFAHKDQPYLNDQNNWVKKTDLPGAVINGPFTEIESFAGKLVFAYNSVTFDADTLYYVENNTLSKYGTAGHSINDLKTDGSELFLSMYGGVDLISTSMTQTSAIFQYLAGIPQPMSCIRFNNNYWTADRNHGLVKIVDNWNNEVVYSNSPFTDGCYRLDIQYGKVLVAGGGLTHNLVNNYFRNGVYVFEDETWTNYNYKNTPEMDFNTDYDFVSVAVNPNNTDQIAFSSFSTGGVKFMENGVITEVFTDANSTLEASGGKYAVGDMKFDDAGNLWIVCTGVEPLKVRMANGEWHSFPLGSAAKDKYPYRLFIDSNGNKWVAVTNAGLIAYNENGTFDIHSDDDSRIFSTAEGYGNLPSVFVKGIAEDLDGEIWIGTEEGMVVLYSTADLYDGGYGDYDFNFISLQVGVEVEHLLGETYITSIAVDGGNRKWIGTNSAGVFCLSPDGMEEIYRFTTDNSPLISNNVLDIRIDHLTGEVYFATDKGLVSFRSDASLFDEQFSNVKVFPNPVRPEFSGPITIQGLGYQADVKVTDISGNVVFTTTSNGGTAIWDGKTLSGDRVQSGVYLIWTASTDGKGKEVAKILFLN